MFDYDWRIQQARETIDNADYILIGGGAGLSDAAGLQYFGDRFTKNFAPFIEKYAFEDLYTSSFYPFETQEERWAYWAKHISLNHYDTPATQLYKNLLCMVQGKKYFVITTNVEQQFVKAGFKKDRIFAVQGDYGLFQCAVGCHNVLYDNEKTVKAMVESILDCRIPVSLVPKCPVCGGEMDVNIRHNEYFVQSEGWYEAERLYLDFIEAGQGKKVTFLELGVGFNTPGIIRFPFEQMTYQNKDTSLIRINRDYPNGAKENTGRTIAFLEDMNLVIAALNSNNSKRAEPVSIKNLMEV